MAAPQMAPAAPQKVKPGIAGIIIGIVMIVLGPIGCIGTLIVPFGGLIGQIKDIAESASGKNRVDAGTSQDFKLEDVENLWIFGVGGSQSDADAVTVAVTTKDGSTIPCETSDTGNTSGNTGAKSFALVCVAELGSNTEITVAADGPPGSQAALVSSNLSLGKIGGFIIGGFAIGILLPLIGLILLIVTAVRRSKAKKALATGWGGPPPGMPGAAPPAPGMAGTAPPPPGAMAPPPAPMAPPPAPMAPPPAPMAPPPAPMAPPPAPAAPPPPGPMPDPGAGSPPPPPPPPPV